jgi:dTDP-4-amino-4,6-dideoxygalactose transaminase
MRVFNVTKSTLPNVFLFFFHMLRLWKTHQLTNGGYYHTLFLDSLKRFTGSDNLVLYSNGHLALESALRVLDISGKVITTPFTFPSTVHAITRLGLEPIFCDINPIDFTIDVNAIERLITPDVGAILAVHVYGNICDVETLEMICQRNNIKLIFDGAHSFGILHKAKNIACYGDVTMFSFHAAKVFHSIEGGLLSFKDKKLRKLFELDKNFGIEDYEKIHFPGGNAKMNEFQSLMGYLNLRYFNTEIRKRRRLTIEYVNLLGNVNGLRIVTNNSKDYSNYSYFVIELIESNKNRDLLHEFLVSNGINSRKYFYPLVNDYECYKDKEFVQTELIVAKSIVDRVLALPLYGSLHIKDVRIISKYVKQFMLS